MRGNPVAYRNLYRHLKELLSFIEISLDSDFILEELESAIYECQRTFGKKHEFTKSLLTLQKKLYKEYIDKKALPLSQNGGEMLKNHLEYFLSRYFKKELH
ncbi:MAG: hypothetical protein U9O98_08720 [Asgard group archaeon]|nr:hypothetical protein [Asgard group archaeon]